LPISVLSAAVLGEKSGVETAQSWSFGEGRAKLIHGKICPWLPGHGRRREILSPVGKPQFLPGRMWVRLGWLSSRFSNRSLDYSGNDTETPKDFILQVPRGRLGIAGLCSEDEAGTSEKSFSHSCYPGYRRKGRLRSEASPFERRALWCKLLKNKHDCGFLILGTGSLEVRRVSCSCCDYGPTGVRPW
jgi:hypothetical protein